MLPYFSLQLLLRDLDVVNREVETKEARLGELSGPKYMKKDEFKAYAAALRAKTARYKQLKAELSEARQETVILAHTENILKSKAGNLDKFLQRMEEKKGIAGYTAVQVRYCATFSNLHFLSLSWYNYNCSRIWRKCPL